MSVSEEATAAFLELHRSLKSLEDTVQGSVESGTSGVMTRVVFIEQLVNTSGLLSEGPEARRSNIAWSKGCSDIPIFGGEYEEYEAWQYKVRIFLNFEYSLIPRFVTFLESLDREIDVEDVQDYATTEDFPGRPADVTWMSQQLFNVLAQKTSGDPFQTVKNTSEEKVCCVPERGSNFCVLTKARMQAGVRDSKSESMTSSACHRPQKSLLA